MRRVLVVAGVLLAIAAMLAVAPSSRASVGGSLSVCIGFSGACPSPVGACSGFCDEFTGASLDTSQWVAVDNTIGNTNANQCDQASNAAVTGGFLTETFHFNSTTPFTCPGAATGGPGLSCSAGTCTTNFASSEVQTRDFAFAYGTVIVNAKTIGPSTTFGWPAIWLLGHDCQHPQYLVAGADAPPCSWPNPGSEEIDMPDWPSGSAQPFYVQIYESGGVQSPQCDTTASDASAGFHTYELDWTPSTLTWKLDGAQKCQLANHMSGEPMFLLLQSAYDGSNAQIPTVTTAQFDYVHVTVAGPDATVKPSISGSTVHGSVLTANSGTWTGSPTTFTRQWLRCNSSGLACSPISGATASTYTTTVSDVGHEIQVLVTASNASGATQYGSVPTAAVT